MNRAELVKTLELIKPALAAGNTPIPIFQCFTFDKESVAAYDDAIAIVGPHDLQPDAPFGLHGNTLLGLLSNSSVEEVNFDFKGHDIILTMGKSVSKLPFSPQENFIFELPNITYKASETITTSFVNSLKLCLGTVSKDTTQKALAGITIAGKEMYSCDGDALTRIILNNGIGKNRVLLSTPFCEAVVKLWSTLDMVKGKLHISDEWVFAEFDEWAVYGQVLEIPTPIDFANEIKKAVGDYPPAFPVPDGFAEALSRARVLADPESQKTQITVTKGVLKISTITHMGQIKDELPFKGHPDIAVNVNAAYIQRALAYGIGIAFVENCTMIEQPDVLQIVSHMG